MKSFEAKWNDLKASGSAQEEATRVEDMMAFVQKNQIRYQLAVSDATTGNTVPVAEVTRNPTARLRVHVTADESGRKLDLTWEPRDPANVVPLLRE
jgi:hypothetical protein